MSIPAYDVFVHFDVSASSVYLGMYHLPEKSLHMYVEGNPIAVTWSDIKAYLWFNKQYQRKAGVLRAQLHHSTTLR